MFARSDLDSLPSDIDEQVASVRAFNRYWTNTIRLLRAGLLDTPYSLTEARVVFELAQDEVMPLARLREIVDIDAGYLSRIMNRFKTDGLVHAEPAANDARRQVVSLTDHGRSVFAMLDDRSRREIRQLLEPMSRQDRRRLVAAMATIRKLTGDREPDGRGYVLRGMQPGDFGWVVHRHGALYDQQFGWDETFEALVARIVADYIEERRPGRDHAWIAEVDGQRAGCVFCVAADDTTAKLRLLLVERAFRGLGIGSRLVEECIRFARRAGYGTLTLWTNDVLTSARRIYEAAGFQLTGEDPHHSFGHDLTGQTWELDLTRRRT